METQSQSQQFKPGGERPSTKATVFGVVLLIVATTVGALLYSSHAHSNDYQQGSSTTPASTAPTAPASKHP